MKKVIVLMMFIIIGIYGQGKVEVKGTGIVQLTPNIVKITIGTRTANAKVDEAIKENSVIAENLTKELLSMGIYRNDLFTSSYNIYHQSANSYNNNTASYEVANNISVTIRDINMLSTVINTCVNLGANNIWGISFDSDKRSENEALARKKAVEDARNKALEYAEYTNMTLGNIELITESVETPALMPLAKSAYLDSSNGINAPSTLNLIKEVKIVYELNPIEN